MKDDSSFVFAGLWKAGEIQQKMNGCTPAQSSRGNQDENGPTLFEDSSKTSARVHIR